MNNHIPYYLAGISGGGGSTMTGSKNNKLIGIDMVLTLFHTHYLYYIYGNKINKDGWLS